MRFGLLGDCDRSSAISMYLPEAIWDTSLNGTADNLGPTMNGCLEQCSTMEEMTGGVKLADVNVVGNDADEARIEKV